MPLLLRESSSTLRKRERCFRSSGGNNDHPLDVVCNSVRRCRCIGTGGISVAPRKACKCESFLTVLGRRRHLPTSCTGGPQWPPPRDVRRGCARPWGAHGGPPVQAYHDVRAATHRYPL